MDPLDRLGPSARDLLSRVDAVLIAAGAPEMDPVWPLLRRVGALPGDAFDSVLSFDPAAISANGDSFRDWAHAWRTHRGEVSSGVLDSRWQGSAAAAFAADWQAMAAHLGDATAGDQPSLTGRLLAMAAYLDEVAEWMGAARRRLAEAMALALSSAQAVTLRGVTAGRAGLDLTTPQRDPVRGPAAVLPTDVVVAAAAITRTVLGVVDEMLRVGDDLREAWEPRLAELPFQRSAAAGSGSAAPTTRVQL